MHPSLTPEAQEEKRQAYERVPSWERQRVNPARQGRHRCNAKQQRRAARKAGNRTRNAQRRRSR